MKLKDLPIYDDPFDGKEVKIVPDPPNKFTDGVSSVRKSVGGAITSTMNFVEMVDEKISIGKAHTMSALETLQNDPGSLPRAGVITVAGLGGLVAGYRRGLFRRGVYAGMAMTVAASVCYPNQAVDIANVGYQRAAELPIVDRVSVLGKQARAWWAGQKGQDNASSTVNETKAESSSPTKKTLPVDMGQSKPEDKDMYTTRS